MLNESKKALLEELLLRRQTRKECRKPAFWRQVASYVPEETEEKETGLGVQDHEREVFTRLLFAMTGGRTPDAKVLKNWLREENDEGKRQWKSRAVCAVYIAWKLPSEENTRRAVTALRSLKPEVFKEFRSFIQPFLTKYDGGQIAWSADIKCKVIKVPSFRRGILPFIEEEANTARYNEWITVRRESEMASI